LGRAAGHFLDMPTPRIRRRNRARPSSPDSGSDGDLRLLERLRAGEEAAFVTLVGHPHDAMLRLARTFVRSSAVAEEVVQDTWLGVLRGIDRFEGRSSLRTWLLTILVNRARSTGEREARTVALGDFEPAVDPARFGADGAWSAPPQHWVEDVEDRTGSAQPRLAAACGPHSPRCRRGSGRW
jgi:RNA polymerase sigma-70 factor (ECF subfamily)